jgi:hypothetical protein
VEARGHNTEALSHGAVSHLSDSGDNFNAMANEPSASVAAISSRPVLEVARWSRDPCWL